jgi:hypothetical protein
MNLTSSQFNRVLERAVDRGVLPTALGSRALRETFSASIRRGAVFSARVANADFLQGIYNEVAAVLEGGYENDKPMARLRLKQLLQRLGYTAEGGFPGDEDLDIPPAEPGSLQDLASDLRLNLILDTQTALMRGVIQKAQGEEGTNARMFPWWELVRIESRRVPRGSPDSGSMGWAQRWVQARGPAPVTFQNQLRLIAPKGHWVWHNLGDSGLFDDALDVEHPPFAFRSGWGWRQVHWKEGQEMGLDLPKVESGKQKVESGKPLVMPAPRASVKRMNNPVRAELEASLKAYFGDRPVRSTAYILRLGDS